MPSFRLYWSPEGKQIATVEAADAHKARRKAPLPYRRYPGEIYACEALVTRYVRIYSVTWWSDGKCEARSQVNGTLIGTWDHGEWYGALNGGHVVPPDVQALAAECRPIR